jgi:ribosomal protein S18 acetylase RimI-like enzyme
MRVEEVTKKDIDGVYSLMEEVYPEREVSPEGLLKMFRSRSYHILVLVSDVSPQEVDPSTTVYVDVEGGAASVRPVGGATEPPSEEPRARWWEVADSGSDDTPKGFTDNTFRGVWGYVITKVYPDRVEVLDLAVAPEVQGLGWGSHLLDNVVDLTPNKKPVVVEVDEYWVGVQLFLSSNCFVAKPNKETIIFSKRGNRYVNRK